MNIERIPKRIGERVEELRDRTAELVASDGEPLLRELDRLSHRIDAVLDTVGQRLDRLDEEQDDRFEELLAARQRTTWPRRLFWMLLGAAAGVGAALLAERQDR